MFITRKVSILLFFLLLCSSSVLALDGDDGTNISISLFFILITAGLIIASVMNKEWSQDETLNMVIRRGLLLLGFFSAWATSAVLTAMGANSGTLAIGNIITSYMSIFGYAIMAATILLFWEFFQKLSYMMGQKKQRKRMSEDADE